MPRAAVRPRRGGGIRRGEARSGWLFVAPAVIITTVFLVVPILLALWVSFSDWNGFQSPLNPRVQFVGLAAASGLEPKTAMTAVVKAAAVRILKMDMGGSLPPVVWPVTRPG